MSKLIIYGASDDLVEVEGEFDEEFGAYNGWRGRVVSPGGESLIVTTEYDKRGGDDFWTLSVESNGPLVPSWPVRFIQTEDGPGVAPAIEIDVPAGTVVEGIS